MLTYAQWDIIADAYIPILAAITLFLLIHSARISGAAHIVSRIKVLALSVLFVYLLMYVDAVLGIWPRFGLDYSTHTALALVFVYYLIHTGKKYIPVLAGSMCLYGALMIYQAYHTVWDIVSTAVAILPGLWILSNRATHDKGDVI